MERKISKRSLNLFYNLKNYFKKIISGYIQKEIAKEAEIYLEEGDETCEAPKQRDMFALEVKLICYSFLF